MSEIAAALVAWLVVYSYPVVGLTVLVSAVGLPLPSTAVVLAAAGLAADGDPEPGLLTAVVFLAAVCGDVVSYALARWGGTFMLDHFGPRVGLTPERIVPLERQFERWGGLLVIATRCLLTGLALPTNLVAGAGGYPIRRFIASAAIGEGIWTAGLMSLGWWYGSNWVALLDYVSDAFTTLTALAAAGILGVLLVQLLRANGRAASEQPAADLPAAAPAAPPAAASPAAAPSTASDDDAVERRHSERAPDRPRPFAPRLTEGFGDD